MRIIAILCLLIFAAASATAQQDRHEARRQDRAPSFQGKQRFLSEDGFLSLYLPAGFTMEKDPTGAGHLLVGAGELRIPVELSGDMVPLRAGNFRASLTEVLKDLTAQHIAEARNGKNRFTASAPPRQYETPTFLSMEGELRDELGVTKSYSLLMEIFPVNGVPHVGVTITQRIFFPERVMNSVVRWVAIPFEKAFLAAIFSASFDERALPWSSGWALLAPVLAGVVPAAPPENRDMEQSIVGAWLDESAAQWGTGSGGGEAEGAVMGAVTFTRDGAFVWRGTVSVTGGGLPEKGAGSAPAGGDQQPRHGKYRIFGRRLILLSGSGGNMSMTTFPVAHPEPDVLIIGGRGYIRTADVPSGGR